jgi:type 1 glutamine amidotransferase
VLLFSKATGFVHGESIEAGKAVFNELAGKNDWFLYSTDESGVFNMEQLSRFDAVIFNNSTGRVLNDEQQEQLRHYVEQGGTLIGIHGAGDNSHHWEWYVESLTGAPFSHHSLHPQLQDAVVTLNPEADSAITAGLPSDWTHTEEWYVFTENPGNRGFTIVYSIDGETINPDGNILWISDKNFGMGNEHPVAWYRDIGKGRTLYTSLGHDAGAWGQEGLTRLLENAVNSVPERGNQQD